MKYRHRALLLLMLALASCATPPGRRGALTGDLDASAQRDAAAAYRELLGLEGTAEPRAVRDAGVEILETYPGARDEAHVLLITAQAAADAGDSTLSERLLDRLVRLHASSPYAVEGAWRQAQSARERGRWSAEADALVRFYSAVDESDPRSAGARDRLRELLDERLNTQEIDALARSHPQSAIGSTASWLAARRLHEEGGDPGEVAERLENFLRDYPRSRYAEDARALLGQIRRDFGIAPSDRALDVAAPGRIGLLVPFSGENAEYGLAMHAGAVLAIEEHARITGEQIELVEADTRGDEVVAVLAARRLIEDENVIAIVGCLLSSTTVAVATLCQERGVPIVSPTATKETIGDLGSFVFQANLTKDIEARMVARAGVLALQRQRFGILYPNGEEGQALAARFRDEVQRWGGRVVVERGYERSTTDFAAEMRDLRALAPEALYVPAGPTEMRLIAPQLVFRDVRTQLLGPSNWNNSMLLREAGASLERAVFPSDVAAVPEEERQRFEELWRRRTPGSPPDAIGLKSYFAMRSVVGALDRETGNTRQRVRDRLDAILLSGGEASQAGLLQPLRVVQDGRVTVFPAAAFPPRFTAHAQADSANAGITVIEDLRR
jgi:branched-chain amino acid transport system substrate-binding protein